MKDIITRIKNVIETMPDIEFGRVGEQRARTFIGVNSPNPLHARNELRKPAFAQAIGAQVVPVTKTKSTGFMVRVDDPAYGKPIYIRIRKGGQFASGFSNEEGLAATLMSAIENGVKSVTFKDPVGGAFTITGMVSARRCGSDAGSRMGNRGDVEIMDSKGKAHRISIKQDNASSAAGLKRFFDTYRLKIQKNLKLFLQSNGLAIPPKGYVALPITNEKLFRFCWFGRDIDAGGGVVIGNFQAESSFTLNRAGTGLVVKCTRAFSPQDNMAELMDDDLIALDLLLYVEKTYHTEILNAKLKRKVARYELEGFDIDDAVQALTSSLEESWLDEYL